MVMFLDYDGVVNTIQWFWNEKTKKFEANYGYPRDNKVNNFQAVQWISELCQRYDIDIVVTSTWRMWDNYKDCLINGGLRDGIKILGKVAVNSLRREDQINNYLVKNPDIGDKFIIIDDDEIVMEPCGYKTKDHFIQCFTNAGFCLEKFEEAERKVRKLLEKEENK